MGYLINDCLNKIIYDSLSLLCILDLTEQEKLQIALRFNESIKRIEEIEEKWKQLEEKEQKRQLDIDKELIEKNEKEDVIKNNAIDKIHERFAELSTRLEDIRRAP